MYDLTVRVGIRKASITSNTRKGKKWLGRYEELEIDNDGTRLTELVEKLRTQGLKVQYIDV